MVGATFTCARVPTKLPLWAGTSNERGTDALVASCVARLALSPISPGNRSDGLCCGAQELFPVLDQGKLLPPGSCHGLFDLDLILPGKPVVESIVIGSYINSFYREAEFRLESLEKEQYPEELGSFKIELAAFF